MENQNFTMYQGETKNISVTNTRDDGTDLDLTGATIKWTVKQSRSSPTIILEKDNSEMTVESNVLTIHLKPPDTENLKGTYYQRCEIVDQQENDSVLFTGYVTIDV